MRRAVIGLAAVVALVLASAGSAQSAIDVLPPGESVLFVASGADVFQVAYREDEGEGNREFHELGECAGLHTVTVTNNSGFDLTLKAVFDPRTPRERGSDDFLDYEFGCQPVDTTTTTVADTTTTTVVTSTTTTIAPEPSEYVFPGGLPESAFAAVYDAREFSESDGEEVHVWEDETSNNRDLVTKINGNDPAVTTGFFGGAKSVRFNTANKRESMQYWTGTNFYTGDIGIVMVMHPVTLPKDSEVYTSASFGGSIRPLHTDRDYEFKHVIGIVERGGMHQIVVMNGEGGADHGYFGSLEAGRSYVITSYVRDGEFNNRHWLDQALMMDRDNGDNDLDGWGVGSRETEFVDSGGTRYANGAIGFLAFVQMDGLTEDDLLRVRDEVAAEFGVAGF